jgi:branched-chain amino acid transport system ATP-binding protein
MATLLEVENLGAFYGPTQALHGLTFGLEEGGITTLLGANGAGKTTTLRAISGLVKTTGEIRFQGGRIDGRKAEDIARRGIAHVPDGRGTFAEFTVEENLRLGAHTRRDRANIAGDFEVVYSYFPNLKERRRQQAGTLSGGEQQMLALAPVLAAPPRLLIADELSLGLAPLIVQSIFTTLAEARAQGVTVILVEQFVHRALAFADRAVILRRGRIIWQGASADAGPEILARYVSETVASEI